MGPDVDGDTLLVCICGKAVGFGCNQDGPPCQLSDQGREIMGTRVERGEERAKERDVDPSW